MFLNNWWRWNGTIFTKPGIWWESVERRRILGMTDDDASCLIFHLKSVISSFIRSDTPLWELVPFRKIFMRFLEISSYIFLPSFMNLLHCIQGLNVINLNYPELFYWVQNWFHAKKILIKKSSAQENNIIYIRSPC